MFYASELLSLRRKGKFSKCWLAGTLSKKKFFQKFKASTICAINVEETCEDILDMVVCTEPILYKRCSLYLSAQLMIGIIRIFSYQIKWLLEHEMINWIHQFQVQSKLSGQEIAKRMPTKKSRPILGPIDIDASNLFLLPPEPPQMRFPLINLTPDVARITLNEHDASINTAEAMMQATDLLNFGIMTAEDLESLSAREWTFMDSEQDATAMSSVRLPTRDITIIGDEGQEFTVSENGPQEALAREEIASLAVTPTPILAPHQIWPSTPTKHKAPTSPDIETPSKRQRRLEPEIMREVATQEIRRLHNGTSESNIELSSLDAPVIEQTKHKKRKKTKKFKDDQMCIPYDTSATHMRVSQAFDDIVKLPRILSATELLQRPSTRLKLGNKELLAHFQMMILEPILQRFSPEKTRFRSLIGSTTGNTTDLSNADRTKGISSKDASNEHATSLEAISKTDTLALPSITLQHTTTAPLSEFEVPDLAPELPVQQPTIEAVPSEFVVPGLAPELPVQHPTVTSPLPRPSATMKDLASEWSDTSQTAYHPRMSRFQKLPTRESYLKAQQNGDKRSLQRDDIEIAKSSSPLRPTRVDWSKADVSANIDCLISEHDIITFTDLCSPASFARYEAAQLFVICLELHKEKKICLTQTDVPYSQIFIQRYY